MKKSICTAFFSTLLLAGCTSNTLVKQCLGYATEDVVFIVNADDVGMSPDMDKAVIELYEKGIVQTFSLMVPTGNFESSAKYAADHKAPVGLHLTLTNESQDNNSWDPLLSKEEVPTLYNDKGYMWGSVDKLAKHADISDVKKELNTQIGKALAMGLNVTHLDFHQLYWRGRDDFLTATLEIARKYHLPIINQHHWMDQGLQHDLTQQWHKTGLYSPDAFWMFYNPEQRSDDPKLSRVLYSRMFEQAEPMIHHVAIHPAYLSEQSKKHMNDAEFRYDEFKVWSGGSLNSVIKAHNIKFTNYQKLQAVMAEKEQCSHKNWNQL